MPAAEHCTRCGTELTHGSAPDGLCPACLLSGALESDPAGTHEHLIGRRIAHYQILDELGRGGMGEVYRARDTTLKRTVAIKVLPESVADDAERLARFQREAEVLAALNHPNIAAIYGLEKAEGTTALVMELVEGPTLADRIAKGPLPVDEALAIAKQIAEALEAAHEQGIIHRDLKPANVKVRPDGTVKVLDFGLAKAVQPVGTSPNASQSPTITTPAMTQAGVILGTAAYMSPEQAKGRLADKRSDVWAFGALLYEMLVGTRAFEGTDVSDTMAAVLKLEPAWARLPTGLSPVIGTYLRRCLHKDPKQRIHDIADVRLALEGAFEASAPTKADAAARVWWRRAMPVVVVAAVAALLIAGLTWALRPASAPGAVNRFAFSIPDGQTLTNVGSGWAIALSPDGQSIAYSTTDGLYLRAMGELEARLIPSTEGGVQHPFFSPDGQSVAYFRNRWLERIAVGGGTPIVIAEETSDRGSPNWGGAHWSAGDVLWFSQAEGIVRVPATGGTPELVVAAETGSGARQPGQVVGGETFVGTQLMPDGESLLLSVRASQTSQVVVQSLSSGERTVVLEGGTDARYLPTGHLVYVSGNTLFGIAFDADTLSTTGAAVPLIERVRRSVDTGQADYVVSDDGTLVYLSDVTGAETTLVWVDRDGREEAVGLEPASYSNFDLSPDGTRVAIRAIGEDPTVWIYDLARRTRTRLVFENELSGFNPIFPRWTPDGTRVAFGTRLSWKRADGSGTVESLDDTPGMIPADFSPDGQRLVFVQINGAGGGGLGVLTLAEERTSSLVLDGEFVEREAAVSPDGRWLAYNSDETGRHEVYVRPFPDVDSGKWQISTDGGEWPVWNPAADELLYRGPTGVMALAFETEPTFTPGAPTQLFERRILGARIREMDVSPDGQRFLFTAVPEGANASEQIIVVQNWFSELERLVPVD